MQSAGLTQTPEVPLGLVQELDLDVEEGAGKEGDREEVEGKELPKDKVVVEVEKVEDSRGQVGPHKPQCPSPPM